MHRAIYDGVYPKTVLKTARQVGKSITNAAFMIAECVGTDFFKVYYITPTSEQTRKFSHTRVAKFLAYSPAVREGFVGPQSIDNVLLRMMQNGSEMAFTYALDDPDRARGYSADHCFFDEVQDILYDAVIPVIEECMSNSNYQYSSYTGTPKTSENTIEYLWSLSSQSEWVMKCDACGKSTFIVTTKAFGKMGPECIGCRKPLNPRNGRWVDMVDGYGGKDLETGIRTGPALKGFHVSQPIMPENVPAAWNTGTREYDKAIERWGNLLRKMDQYSENQFLNEVIGVSTSTGARLLTKELLEELCDETIQLSRLSPGHLPNIKKVVAGVDWSGGGAEVKGTEGLVKSRTVLHLWGELPDGRLKTLYYKIFPNGHCTGWIEEIVEVCKSWGVQMIVGDAGEGQMANALLRERLGAHRCQQIRYLSRSKPIDYDPQTLSYLSDRTTLIDNFAMFVKNRKVIYGPRGAMKPAIDDILNVYEETTSMGRKVWRHAPTQPDDCLHAQLFGWVAWRILNADLRFY